jgi:hypothetical protein
MWVGIGCTIICDRGLIHPRLKFKGFEYGP